MTLEDMELTAVVQAAVTLKATLIVRVDEDTKLQKWFGQICFHRNGDEIDKQYIILYQTKPIYLDAKTAQTETKNLLAHHVNKKYSGITADTFFRPAQIQAASTVLSYQACLTLVIEKGIDKKLAGQIVERNIVRHSRGFALTVNDLIRLD